jgi:hypothetical protein
MLRKHTSLSGAPAVGIGDGGGTFDGLHNQERL